MTKLLKHSVLALALVLGSTTCAHAETEALYNGGVGGIIQDIIDWLFPHSHSSNNNTPGTSGAGTTQTAPEIDPEIAMSGLMLLGGTLVVLRSRRIRRPETD